MEPTQPDRKPESPFCNVNAARRPDGAEPGRKRKFKFVGCEVLYREACHLAAAGRQQVDVEFLLKGLHDLPRGDMLAKLQSVIDAVPATAGYEAILLGYARCNDGLVGLTARDIPLVIPRAHDCITFFFGSRAAYQKYFDAYSGTYYMTSGWAERNRFEEGTYSAPAYGQQGVMGRLGLTEPYDQMVAKYGKENADFIVETLGGWAKAYSRLLYVEMDVCDETPFIEEARRRAEERHWELVVQKGDWSLLRRLFEGEWDSDFLIVPPGAKIVARNDGEILDARKE
jgi:hypothetical protein